MSDQRRKSYAAAWSALLWHVVSVPGLLRAQSPPGPPATGQAELATGQARALLAMNDFIFMNGLGCCELH